MTIYSGEDFLAVLNERVSIGPKNQLQAAPRADRNQPELFGPRKQLALVKPITHIMCHRCAYEQNRAFHEGREQDVFLLCSGERDGVRKRNADHLIEDDESPIRVVGFGECCGSYSPEYAQKLRELYPNVEWIFPQHMPDFCNSPFGPTWVCDLAFALIEADILTIAEVAAEPAA